MDRSMLLAEVPFKNEGSLVVGSMHFESLNSEKTRISQMNEVYAMTKDGRRVIIAGDHNFGDGSVENKSVPEEFRDLWLASNQNFIIVNNGNFPKNQEVKNSIICSS